MKTQKPKTRKSVFFLTINPNRPESTIKNYENGSEGLEKKLQMACRMFDRPHIKKFLYFATKEENHTYETHISDVKLEHKIEMGDTRKVGLHAHLILALTHQSNIRLSFHGIRRALTKIFGHPVHFHADVIKNVNSIQNLKDYIKKNKTKVEQSMQ